MSSVISVNVAQAMANPDPRAMSNVTGIDKLAAGEPVMVRAPEGVGSGLVGDFIGNPKFHGGDDQAVYVYAREDLDEWERQLQRPLANGNFGENLTTSGIDVTGARIGELWRIGSDGLLLEVSAPRTPCRTFQAFLNLNHWIKTFTEGKTRRLLAGDFAGDRAGGRRHQPRTPSRPRRDDRSGLLRPNVRTGLAPQLLVADALSAELKDYARQRVVSNVE